VSKPETAGADSVVFESRFEAEVVVEVCCKSIGDFISENAVGTPCTFSVMFEVMFEVDGDSAKLGGVLCDE
jgi:hypothetical protein